MKTTKPILYQQKFTFYDVNMIPCTRLGLCKVRKLCSMKQTRRYTRWREDMDFMSEWQEKYVVLATRI